MIRYFILYCLLASACAQPQPKPTIAPVAVADTTTVKIRALISQDDIISCPIEVVPHFPGGEKALRAFLEKNLQYPAEAIRMKKEGTVFVQFLIDSSGVLSGYSTIKWRYLGFGLEEEALRVVKLMPDWEWPMETYGQKRTLILFNLPIRFVLK